MRLGASVEGDLVKFAGQMVDDMAGIITDGMNRAATGLRDELRKQVTEAKLGGDLAKAWRSAVYPPRKKSMGAAGWVFSKSRRIHAAFAEPRTIVARGSRWLVIPQEGAVKRSWQLGGKGGLIGAKPRKWSDFSQILKIPGVLWLPREDGTSVMIALRQGGKGKGRPEPLFLLVRSVRLKGGLDLVGPPQRWLNSLHSELASKLGG